MSRKRSFASMEESSYKHDVFLSFRGEDTRKNFVDHLYYALQQQGIRTYKDDKSLKKGKRIKSELLKSIEESKFCIIVFSMNYASSSWCLDELVKIMECQKTIGQIAYPVFYDVDPSDVRKQRGTFGELFAKHNREEVGKWRKALEEAGNLAGWDLKNTADGHEAKVIKTIVEEISLELRSINLSVDESLIGMEPRIKDIESSLEIGLEDVRMIGIKGIGGGGKTTLARAVFDQISFQFEGTSFVENVREVSKASGLHFLQKQVLSDVLNEQGINVGSVHDGKRMMQTKLRGKKVLVVLDDVDHLSQLDALAGATEWFKSGSRIIITTRDEQVLLAHKVKRIHDVNLLSNEEAICLFNMYAFGPDTPIQEYEQLSGQVVRYAAGLPLTIKVLGSFLCGKDDIEWIDALKRLETIPLNETLEKLELSYIGLENDYKEMLLDVACFLKGSLKVDAIRILECCGFHARNGLKVLEQKSLVTVSNERLGMHDHIQEMGRNIVRRLHPDEPNKHSRLWIGDEVKDILVNDLGNEATTAIEVNSLLELGPEIVTNGFGKMKKLRYLRIGKNLNGTFTFGQFDSNIVNVQVSENIPDALQFLSWDCYPQESLPTTFRASNLVSLVIDDSNIVQLWEAGEGKILNKLRFLKLNHSMLRTLDLEATPNLEMLDLHGCIDLDEFHTPAGCLKRLVFLNLSGCLSIKSFSFIQQLGSLEVLWLSNLSLREFPDIIPRHSNSSLLQLDLSNCRELKSLSGSICGLRHLKILLLSHCYFLEELPEDIGHLEYLEVLDLLYTRIKRLPDSICMLKHLKDLNLKRCLHLEKLPKELGLLECLEELCLDWCENIREIPDSICKLKLLRYLSLYHCVGLEKLPEELGRIKRLEYLNLTDTRIRHLPRSIYSLKSFQLQIHGLCFM